MRYSFIILALIELAVAQVRIIGPSGFTVEFDTLDGTFGLGLVDGTRLTFDYRSPWAGREASHINILLNDTLYTTAEWLFTTCDARDISAYRTSLYWDSTIVRITYDITGVAITEEISVTTIDGIPTARIAFFIANGRETSISYGILVNIDAIVNTDDSPPFEVDSIFFTSGKIFEGEAMPYTVQFHGSEAGGELASRLYLRLAERRPDLLAIGRQSVFSFTCWDIPRDAIVDRPYSDIGFVVRWNERELEPGELDSCVFYFGLGGAWGTRLPLLWYYAHPEFHARACRLDPNPFEFRLEVLNYHDEPLESLYACITLDTLLFLADDSTCKVLSPLYIPSDSSASVTWRIGFDSLTFTRRSSVLVRGTIYLSRPHPIYRDTDFSAEIVIPGFVPIAPFARAVGPRGIISCRDSVELMFRAYSPSTLDPLSPVLSVNDEIFRATDGVIVRNDTIRFFLPPRFYEHAATIRYSLLEIRTAEGCALEEVVSDSFTFDLFPPILTTCYPEPNSTVTESNLVVYAHFIDGPSRVSLGEIVLTVHGFGTERAFTPSSSYLSFYNDTIFLLFSDAFREISYPDTITIRIENVRDNAGICGNNISTPIEWSFYYNPSTHIGERHRYPFMLNVFPNPFNSSVIFDFSVPEAENFTLCITNVLGEKVFEKEFTNLKPEKRMRFVFEPKGLSSGIYFYRFFSNKHAKTGRIDYIK